MRGLQGLRLPIAPMGVERRPAGGLVPEVPGDPTPILKLLVDLQQKGVDRENDLSDQFADRAAKAQEFEWSGFSGAAKKLMEPYGIEVPRAQRPAVPGHPEPIPEVPGRAVEDYYRSILVPGSGAPASVRKEARDGLERAQKARESDRRWSAGQKAADDRFKAGQEAGKKREEAEQRRHEEKMLGSLYPQSRAYHKQRQTFLDDRRKELLESPEGKSRLADTKRLFKSWRGDASHWASVDGPFRDWIDNQMGSLEAEVPFLSPAEWQQRQMGRTPPAGEPAAQPGTITIGAPPAPAATPGKTPAAAATPAPAAAPFTGPSGAKFTPKASPVDPQIARLQELAREGSAKAQQALQQRGISW